MKTKNKNTKYVYKNYTLTDILTNRDLIKDISYTDFMNMKSIINKNIYEKYQIIAYCFINNIAKNKHDVVFTMNLIHDIKSQIEHSSKIITELYSNMLNRYVKNTNQTLIEVQAFMYNDIYKANYFEDVITHICMMYKISYLDVVSIINDIYKFCYANSTDCEYKEKIIDLLDISSDNVDSDNNIFIDFILDYLHSNYYIKILDVLTKKSVNNKFTDFATHLRRLILDIHEKEYRDNVNNHNNILEVFMIGNSISNNYGYIYYLDNESFNNFFKKSIIDSVNPLKQLYVLTIECVKVKEECISA